MIKGIFQNKSVSFNFLLLGFLIIISVLTFSVIGTLLLQPLFGIDGFSQMQELSSLQNQQSVAALKFIQFFNTLGLFLIPSFLFSYLVSLSTRQYLMLNRNISSFPFLISLLIVLGSGPLISFLSDWNSTMELPAFLSGVEKWMKASEESANNLTQAFVRVESISSLLVNIGLMAVLPALSEEILFRGIIQSQFQRLTKSPHWAVFIAAFIFSALHFQFYGFIPRFLLGVYFGYLLVWSKNLWYPILAHFFNNALTVIIYYLIHNQQIDPSFEKMQSTDYPVLSVIGSLTIVGLLLFLLRRSLKVNY